MKIVDGTNMVLGRLASYVAKEALKGEEVIILNCKEAIITGNKKHIKEEFDKRRRRGGSSQKGPVYINSSEGIVKRAIRGMLPDYRSGRGRAAYKRIKCYAESPKEFEKSSRVVIADEEKIKNNKIMTKSKQKRDKFMEIKKIIK